MVGINQLVLMLLCLTMYSAFKFPNIARSSSNKERSLSCHKLPVRATKASSCALHMSFVQDELRPCAIKYHSRDQTSQGQLPAQVPFTKWNPTRQDYLHFLVDSLAVYDHIESSVAVHYVLKQIRVPGLERTAALRKDIKWMRRFDRTLKLPAIGAAGITYITFLQGLLDAGNLPALVCHYYNQYFALSAGGMRIGQFLSGKLLDGKKLHLHTFEDSSEADGSMIGADSGGVCNEGGGDMVVGADSDSCTEPDDHADIQLTHTTPAAQATSTHHAITTGSDSAHLDALKDQLRHKIDALAAEWTAEQRLRCCTETENCFKYGNEMLKYLHGSAGGIIH